MERIHLYFYILGIPSYLWLGLAIPSCSGQSINWKCVSIFRCILNIDKSVVCTNLNLTIIPTCVEDIRHLDLCGSFLQRLDRDDFPDNFNGLETLLLCNSTLKLIEDDAFVNLYNLRELDLSFNCLKHLQPQTFANNRLLERLNLSTNLIKRLNSYQFDLPNLRILDLSNGFLELINETAFSKLPHLEWLNLRDNKLATLPAEVRAPILLLGGSNPWSCDCVFNSLSKQQIYSSEDDLSCLDSERNKFLWNKTAFADDRCDQYFYEEINSTASITKAEKNMRSDNSPALILDVYGYLLIGLTILIFLCCCCDKPRKFVNLSTTNTESAISHHLQSRGEKKEEYTMAIIRTDPT